MDKATIKKTALQLNSPNYPFEFAVNDDSITGYWNWTDTKWFTPGTVTDEQRVYNFTITLLDDFTYLEHEKHCEGYSDKKDDSLKGLLAKAGIKDNDDAKAATPIIPGQNPDDIRGPLRDILKRNGWKKANPLTRTLARAKTFLGVKSDSAATEAPADTQVHNPTDKLDAQALEAIGATPAAITAPPLVASPLQQAPPPAQVAPQADPATPAQPPKPKNPSFDPALLKNISPYESEGLFTGASIKPQQSDAPTAEPKAKINPSVPLEQPRPSSSAPPPPPPPKSSSRPQRLDLGSSPTPPQQQPVAPTQPLTPPTTPQTPAPAPQPPVTPTSTPPAQPQQPTTPSPQSPTPPQPTPQPPTPQA